MRDLVLSVQFKKRETTIKGFNSNNIILVEENEIVNDDGKITSIMNGHFTNITKHMNLKANKINHCEELVNTLDTCKNHKSLRRTKLANFNSKSTIIFQRSMKVTLRKKY